MTHRMQNVSSPFLLHLCTIWIAQTKLQGMTGEVPMKTRWCEMIGCQHLEWRHQLHRLHTTWHHTRRAKARLMEAGNPVSTFNKDLLKDCIQANWVGWNTKKTEGRWELVPWRWISPAMRWVISGEKTAQGETWREEPRNNLTSS